MFLALNVPAWEDVQREPPEPAVGPFEARKSTLGYCWQCVDTRTGQVRASGLPEAMAQRRAEALNRANA